MREAIINEFGEEIPIETIYSLADRIRVLTDTELHELWFNVSYIYAEREPERKCLKYIDRIRAGIWLRGQLLKIGYLKLILKMLKIILE